MRLRTITGREKILHHLRRGIQAQIHPAVVFEEKCEEFLTQILEFQAIICSVRRLRGGVHRHRMGVEYSMADDRFRDSLSRHITEKQRTDIRRLKRELE